MIKSSNVELIEQLDEQHQSYYSINKSQPTIALLHCYDLIDDFLDSINISFEDYCQDFIGSWIFGYINALKQVGVRTILFCISATVDKPTRFIHQPTGTQMCVLPPSRMYHAYRALRRKSLNMYGAKENQSFKDIEDNSSIHRSFFTPLKDLAKSFGTYLCTPLGLLARELKRENCQAILCQEYEYARFDSCVLLGKLINIPVFATFQGGNKTQSILEAPVRQLSINTCKGLIIATQSEIERVRNNYNITSDKVARIFNPLEITTWQAIERQQARATLGIPDDAKVVAWHGRIEIERKGLDVLLDAWQQLCDECPDKDLQLLIVGTGSEANRLQQCIVNMKLRGVMWRNEFVSDRTVLQCYLSAADVYAFPSRLEGFPLAPIEAMSCGLPVVAADAPGVPDIFEGGETHGGIIVPRGDSNALVSGLRRVLEDEILSTRLSRNARRRAEDCFAPKTVGRQLRDVLLNTG
ncbi:glycosyltransferase family 4 protein [Rivularia sp. UHCC 0363]|uniref:glycosyltransferase family 4 protein n=1 Tax=Rivularia sp. UHCC 0363 TaxID=3110244 RepID=UPI002B1EAC6D|nr:glycosyltransferase family 4 protein [Rivularia sp. UHCC 0363]MEA5593799.1 glycosyltransferase family 4 protein [Rivularia sp. UHCC 0363]